VPQFASTAARDARVYSAQDLGQWVTVAGTPPAYYLITSVSAAGVATFSGIGAAPVTSVFGRIGAVVATLGDYVASKITNDSSWAGATVKDALNSIFAGTVFSFNGRVGTVLPADADYDTFQVGAPATISTARTIAAGRNVIIATSLTLLAGGNWNGQAVFVWAGSTGRESAECTGRVAEGG